MCQQILFKSEGKIVGSMAELSLMLAGGFDAMVLHADYGDDREAIIGDGESCLCPVDVAATLEPTDYVLSQWEDGVDWTARKPDWLVEMEQRERDKARYEAAMAETRAAQGIETRSAETPQEVPSEG